MRNVIDILGLDIKWKCKFHRKSPKIYRMEENSANLIMKNRNI